MILKQVSFGTSEKVDIFKTNDGYATTLVKKWGPFWYESERTSYGEVMTVLSWNQSFNLISLNAVAYSKKNQPLPSLTRGYM